MDPLAVFIVVGILYLVIFFKTVRIVIGLTLLGAVLGACVGIAALSKFSVPWEPLGTPPSGAVQIIQLAGEEIYVKAADGETYSCGFRSQDRCWVRAKPLDPPLNEGSWAPSYSYDATPEVSVSERSASISYWHFEGGTSTRWFELRADGSVWSRVTGINPMIFLLFLVEGTLAGGLLGFFGSVLFALVQYLRRRARAKVAQRDNVQGM